MKALASILFLTLIFLLNSCGEAQKNKIKIQQYTIEGKRLYEMHCSNCHQPDGSGLKALIPPISKSFIIANPNIIVCAIKYGLQGPIIIDSTRYNGKMPGSNRLTSIEIAEIMTFLNNNWGDKKELFSIDSVNSILSNCTKRSNQVIDHRI
ncbi:MAG: cytochrome c [Reichenbachiella sp.]